MKVRVYWWVGKPNFGDALAPLLLSRFADIDDAEWVSAKNSQVLSVGSVLEHVPHDWAGHILGSGKLHEKTDATLLKSAKILALRGHLSAKGVPGNIGIGDPGLLANELIEYQEKKWDVGIVPHWKDTILADRFTAPLLSSKRTFKVISPASDPISVIKDIAACKTIITSSLHGMIVADAIGGIPRRVEFCDRLITEGGLFKFHDYSTSIKTKLEVGRFMEPSRNHVNDAKFEIYDAYRELGKVYAN